MPDRIF